MSGKAGFTRPNSLVGAPLQYAPRNELGVVFLFAHIAKRLQFRIEEIRPNFPDCLAFRRAGSCEKLVRIEFEFRSSNFRTHKHDCAACDCIVCWEHDWPDVPDRVEVIELKRFFGCVPKVWLQPAIKSQWQYLDSRRRMEWGLSSRTSAGDLLLMYRCFPDCCIRSVFVLETELDRGKAGWRQGDAYFGRIHRLCDLDSPVFLDDLRNHRVLRTASFVRRNLQGNHLVSEYWPYLYQMIVNRNRNAQKVLATYAPQHL